jgi:hypothetical protein
MRSLTIDEKITIKGALSRYGVPSLPLASLDMEQAVLLFPLCTGRSIKFFYPHRVFVRAASYPRKRS